MPFLLVLGTFGGVLNCTVSCISPSPDKSTFSSLRALDLKTGVKKKITILMEHRTKLEPVAKQEDLELFNRILLAPAIQFSDTGFTYILKSGTNALPWSEMLKGDLETLQVHATGPKN